MVIIAQIRACLNRKKRKAGQNIAIKRRKLKFFNHDFQAAMPASQAITTLNQARGALAL
jgi:hypothetical protein